MASLPDEMLMLVFQAYTDNVISFALYSPAKILGHVTTNRDNSIISISTEMEVTPLYRDIDKKKRNEHLFYSNSRKWYETVVKTVHQLRLLSTVCQSWKRLIRPTWRSVYTFMLAITKARCPHARYKLCGIPKGADELPNRWFELAILYALKNPKKHARRIITLEKGLRCLMNPRNPYITHGYRDMLDFWLSVRVLEERMLSRICEKYNKHDEELLTTPYIILDDNDARLFRPMDEMTDDAITTHKHRIFCVKGVNGKRFSIRSTTMASVTAMLSNHQVFEHEATILRKEMRALSRASSARRPKKRPRLLDMDHSLDELFSSL